MASGGEHHEKDEDYYGDAATIGALRQLYAGYAWADVASLGPESSGRAVRVRGAAQAVRAVGRRVAFLVLRQGAATVQCVVAGDGMARFAAGLSRESVVDVAGAVSLPREPVRGTTQQGVEIRVEKLHCVSRAVPALPIGVDDAARSEEDVARARAAGEQVVHVGQDKRLDYRVIDLRTAANQAIFRVQCEVENVFRQVLLSEGFVGIHTPKLIGGSSEGGAAVFKLDYNGQPACLAQSPQLHKQMAVCGGFGRVFEVGPVFRAEDSNTHRHLCEFVGLDVEMALRDHYTEVCDVVDKLFVAMFDHLNDKCGKELEAIQRQYPFEPLKYLRTTLRMDYDEGIRMLQEAGVHVDPMGDLNTEAEKKLMLPREPVRGTTQQGVEIRVEKLHCVSRAVPALPIGVDDAARSEEDVARARAAGEQVVHVGQDKRLDYRVIDLRTAANQAIFRVQCEVENVFRQVLLSEGFVGIHTPKLIGGSSEGGAAVFKLDYNGQPACLAQSPQLHKQMAVCGGFGRVFEVGPVFRAEDSNTHRHLCEFVGLDVEMALRDHYTEVCDVVDKLFVAMFDHLNDKCGKELEAIQRQYPFEPLKYLRTTLRMDYDDGIRMLQEAGVHVDPMGDLNTEAEKKLGDLVRDRYGTEFYMLCRYPSAVRPFYTMPCPEDPRYSCSFDVFVRGEEIISGAQRVHVPDLLAAQAAARGIDVASIATYVDAFRYGAPPHGGFGVGLERVVMLFCGLGNIRKTSLFPRDPRRLAP